MKITNKKRYENTIIDWRPLRPYIIRNYGKSCALVLASLESAHYRFEKNRDSEGYFFFSHNDIANEIGLSRRCVVKTINKLIKHNLIKSKKSNDYRANWYKVLSAPLGGVNEVHRGVKQVHRGYESGSQGDVNGVHITDTNTDTETDTPDIGNVFSLKTTATPPPEITGGYYFNPEQDWDITEIKEFISNKYQDTRGTKWIPPKWFDKDIKELMENDKLTQKELCRAVCSWLDSKDEFVKKQEWTYFRNNISKFLKKRNYDPSLGEGWDI